MKKCFKLLIMALAVICAVGIAFPASTKAAGELKLNSKYKTIFVNGSKVRPEYTDSYILKLKNKPKKYSVKWTSEDESIATVEWMKSGKATVKAVGIGITNVTAQVHDKVTGQDYTLSCRITVKKNCTQVAIVPEVLGDINVGESIQLDGKMFDENGKIVTNGVEVTDSLKWISDNPEVATVDENGIVKGISRGEATITLYAGQTKIGTYSKPETAVAEKQVKVSIVGTMLLGVKQVSLNKFVMTFSDSLQEEVKAGDIIVSAINVASAVENVEIDETKCLVTVTTTTSFNEDSKYTVKWKDFEGSFNATKGQPAKIELYTNVKDDCVIAGNSTEVKVRFYNEYGVDITPISEKATEFKYLMNKVSLHVKPVEGAVDTGAWVTDNKIMFQEAGKAALVVADYIDIKNVNGVATEYRVSASLKVSSISEASTITLDDIMLTNSTLTGSKLDWESKDHNIVAIDDNDYRVVARMRNAEGKFIYSDEIQGKVTFKVSGNASVIGVFGNGVVFPVSSGSDVIIVDYDKTSIGAKEVAVVPKRVASRIVYESDGKLLSSKKVSSNYGVGKCDIVVKVLDQYGKVLKLNSLSGYNYTTDITFELADSIGPMATVSVDKDGLGHANLDVSGFGSKEGRIFTYKVNYNGAYGKVSSDFVIIGLIPDSSLESKYEVKLEGKTDVTMDSKSVEFPVVNISLGEYKGDVLNTIMTSIYPAVDNGPSVNGLYYYRVIDKDGKQIKDGLELGKFSLVYPEGSLLKKYAAGDYSISIFKGVNGGYEYITGTAFTVTDSKASVNVEQIAEITSTKISKNMTEADITNAFNSCFKVMVGNENVPISNIIIEKPILGDNQMIFRNIKVRDFVTVNNTAYYFEFDVVVNKQIVNQ